MRWQRFRTNKTNGMRAPGFKRGRAVALAMLLGSLASPATASSTLFENGEATGTSGVCANASASCGGNGWIIYTPFTLQSDAQLTGASYWFSGSAVYSSTNWSIWIADPRVSFADGPAFFGNEIGTLTAATIGSMATLSSLSINLAMGTYWFGFSNNVLSGVSEYGRFSATSLLSLQSQLGGSFADDPFVPTASVRMIGTAVTESVTWAMLILGFGLVGGVKRFPRDSTLVTRPKQAM